MVSDKYQIYQNRQLVDFVEQVVRSGDLRFDTGGSLRGGAQVWYLAHIPKAIGRPGDPILPYVLVSSSHDGTQSVMVQLTSVRVVCRNTLNLAMRGAGSAATYKVRHLGESSLSDMLSEAENVLGLTFSSLESADEQIERLADTRVSLEDVRQIYANAILNAADADVGAMSSRASNILASVMDLLDHPHQKLAGEGSAWAALNAWTQYATHDRSTRSTGLTSSPEEARLRSLWFGTSADLTERIRTDLLALSA
jgi:phage/plasmid-like protein (TIGR03299 family)